MQNVIHHEQCLQCTVTCRAKQRRIKLYANLYKKESVINCFDRIGLSYVTDTLLTRLLWHQYQWISGFVKAVYQWLW